MISTIFIIHVINISYLFQCDPDRPIRSVWFTPIYKGIESLPQTLIFQALYLWNQMLYTLDISNYEWGVGGNFKLWLHVHEKK